ncbi:hypothetical protein [Acinetobacter sp. YH12045]|uniref:hypothetical protein n=1 Tax=Acinetobacter sp. YH12045 TaxID=2601051 RepID=UPI0015D3E5CF|nr:hypothetical protein [Acinetobacter sp. YH12045]
MLQHRLATPVIQPRMHFSDKEGQPLIGGKVYSFKVGEDIFKPTYRNSEFTAVNQNPILLDQAGSALIYVRGSVQLKIYDKSGVFIEEKIVYQQQMRTQFFDKYGKALGSGKVWTYDYQSTIKKPSYENADDTLLNPNPVVLDENGYGSISIVGAYRLRQYDKKGVFVSDQDFKRPPARVLTSTVYPLYFEEGVVTGFSMTSGEQRVVMNEASLKDEKIGTSFSILSASVRDVFNQTLLLENVSTKFSITSVVIREAANITTMKPEAALTNFVLSAANQKNVLISNIAQPETVSTAFGLLGAKITN